MKTILFLLIALALSSCYNYTNEIVVVKEITSPTAGKERYRVELSFKPYSQYLYTDSLYYVGDTVYFNRK